MATLADLLRYKKPVELKDSRGTTLMTVYMRVLSDADISAAYKKARVASARKRNRLRDVSSEDYADEMLPFFDAKRVDCTSTILASRSSNFLAEAISANSREELPTMRDIALDPDSPTLEEQEKLDQEVEKREKDYQKSLMDFVETKRAELLSDLEQLSDEDLRQQAMEEAVNILSMTEFLEELKDQKAFRSVYLDENCTQRAFETIDDFRGLHSDVIDQLRIEYEQMEISADDLKN